jgi:hypothetical protein
MSDKLPTAAPSNHRCLLLTTKFFDDDCSFMEKVKAERQVEAEENRLLAARGAVVEGVQMCACAPPPPVGLHS